MYSIKYDRLIRRKLNDYPILKQELKNNRLAQIYITVMINLFFKNMNFYIFIIAILFSTIWTGYRRIVLRKYKYKFYALRDELRDKVISGKIKKHNWVFSYLDSSISKSIVSLKYVNLWSAVLLEQITRMIKDLRSLVGI